MLTEYVKRLIKGSRYGFEPLVIPKELNSPGIYLIHDTGDSLLYGGRTYTVRKRILGNHRSGDRKGSAFRRALSEEKGFRIEKEITDYVTSKCAFKYLTMSKELSTLEHFAIAVLEPRLNR